MDTVGLSASASVTATMQITRTMEMVSTAKIRKALERAEQAAPYKDAIKRMLANVANAGVDLPIDLKVHERDDFVGVRERRFERNDPYFESVANGWAEALGIALAELPDFHF